jgi:hypothetical protein
MDIEALINIGKYLEEKEKPEWALIIQRIIMDEIETAIHEEDDVDYSEDEGDAVPEGVPEVRVDERGFQCLI